MNSHRFTEKVIFTLNHKQRIIPSHQTFAGQLMLELGMTIYRCRIDISIFLNIEHDTIFYFTYRYTFDISHFTFVSFSFTAFPFSES